MPCRELRRATREEIAKACFIRHVSMDDVAEAWVDQHGKIEIVLHGFIDRLTVTLGFTGEPA